MGKPAFAGRGGVEDVVVFGGGQVGTAIARLLAAQDIGVRLIEPDRDRARAVAEELPDVRVYNATGVDVDFLERELIGRAQAAVLRDKKTPRTTTPRRSPGSAGSGSRSPSSTTRSRHASTSTRAWT